MMAARSSSLNMLGSAAALSRIEAYGEARGRHVPLGLADRELAEMENRGGKRGGGAAIADAGDEMIKRADPARGDHRHRDRVGHGAGEGEIIAHPGAVAIHGGEQNFARAERYHLARVFHGVEPSRVAA